MESIKRLFCILTLTLTCSAYAHADIYVDFGDDFTGLPASYGAVNSPGVWNDIVSLGSTSGLLDTNGDASGVSLVLNATSASGHLIPANNNDETLLHDNFLSTSGNSWSAVFSGLQNGLYDVYYYAPANTNVSTGTFSINGQAQSSLSGGSTLVQGQSWAVQSGVVVNSGQISILSTSTASNRGLSGVQFIAVPEPSAACLLGLVLFACGLRRRR